MRTMQQKYLKRVETLAEDNGYEAVQVADYGNTGTIYIQQENSVSSDAEVYYNFQSGTVTFTITIRGIKMPSQPPREGYFDFYMNYSDNNAVNNFFKRLSRLLNDIKVKKRK